VFYVRFLSAELRRRRGRTALTALGLAVGVGLVVIVSALSAGLDDAQEEVLAPLTGVGTDMRVSRPLSVPDAGSRDGTGGFASLSEKERRILLEENPGGGLHFDPAELGQPGEAFLENRTISSELSFPVSEVRRISTLDGVEDAAAALSLQAVRIEGEVPRPGSVVNPHGPGGYDIASVSVTGVEVDKPSLAPVTPGQVIEGKYFSLTSQKARGEAILDIGYARQNRIEVGDRTDLAGGRFEVVGLSAAPLGGAASNVYLELARLQRLSDREDRANVMQVRAESTASVDALSRQIRDRLTGAQVTTAADLADRVGGSLADAKNLSTKLGTALAILALGAAFLIATLLALSGVQQRVRELGTLKALGWRQRLVVRQVSAESVVQGLLGGVLGAALGIAGAALIDALHLKLEASVAQTQSSGLGPFGQGKVNAGSTEVLLGAPLDVGLLALAVALAVLGGLLAGGAGGLRVARLRPAEALRSAE
jgi:ABC-type antimicrobial peptide transport system permease subunit